MERRKFVIDDIYTSGRKRSVDHAKVAEIAASIAKVGLMNSPAVRIVNEMMIDGEAISGVPVLVHGHHRIRALQLLDETVVECIIIDTDEKRARLMEIDENLARAELGPAEEMDHLLCREELWAEIEAEDAKKESGDLIATLPKTGRGNKQFAAQIAAITGEDKSTINKKLAVARKVKPLLGDIKGTCLDSQVEMRALADLDEDERLDLVTRAASGEKVSARPETPPRPRATKPSPGTVRHLPELNDANLDWAMFLFDYIPASEMPHAIALYEKANKPKTIAELRKLHAAR